MTCEVIVKCGLQCGVKCTVESYDMIQHEVMCFGVMWLSVT